MIIPEYLLWPDMDEDAIRHLENFVKKNRKRMNKVPSYDALDSAIDAAIQISKSDRLSLPSIWREPTDIGNKFAIVCSENREAACISGYTEVVDDQHIFDLVKGAISTSEESHDVDRWTCNGYGLILNGTPIPSPSEFDPIEDLS